MSEIETTVTGKEVHARSKKADASLTLPIDKLPDYVISLSRRYATEKDEATKAVIKTMLDQATALLDK